MALEPSEIREEYAEFRDAIRDTCTEGDTDMRYVAGDPWDDADRRAREKAGRPCLVSDEIGQYVNQAINDIRQNKRAIKVSPEGDGADDTTADVRANLIRQIEYRSNAQDAYTTGFENTIQRSYGWWRIKPQYVDHRSFDQELRIKSCPNPNLVTPNSDWTEPDGSDLKTVYFEEFWSKKEFQRKFKNAKPVDFAGDMGREPHLTDWLRGERIRLAERWYIETKPRKLLLVQPTAPPPQGVINVRALPAPEPYAVFKDEKDLLAKMQPGDRVIRERDVDYPYVKQCLTNGLEIFEENDFPGTSIPFIPCYGKILYVDDGQGPKRKILSMVRLARDPYMLYCYIRTNQMECVKMTPKTPFIGYKGQFDGKEQEWQSISDEPRAYLEANATTQGTGNALLPLPMRQPYDPPIQSLEILAEAARRAIQAAMGIMPLPTAAQRKNEKSGVALDRIESTSQKGSFHFVDHYDASLRRTGAILNEAIPHYYDAARDVTVRKPDEQTEVIRINAPGQDGKTISTTKGRHDVTIGVGPAFESQRQEASAFADSIVGNQQLAAVVGPHKYQELLALAIRLKAVGPIGDEMADMIAPKDAEPGQPSPQMVAELQQQNQQLQQLLQQAQQIIETEQIKQQAEIEKVRIKAENDLALQDLKSRAEITIASLRAQQQAAAEGQKAQTKVLEIASDAAEAEKDRQQEAGIERLRHESKMTLGQQSAEAQERSAFASSNGDA